MTSLSHGIKCTNGSVNVA